MKITKNDITLFLIIFGLILSFAVVLVLSAFNYQLFMAFVHKESFYSISANMTNLIISMGTLLIALIGVLVYYFFIGIWCDRKMDGQSLWQDLINGGNDTDDN